MHSISLSGRSAAVLAATRGLGRGVAEALAEAGADVALCSRQAAEAQAVAEEIAARYGVRTLGLAADVSRGNQLQTFIEAAGQRFGGLDILVTNAGGPPAGSFEQLTDETWQAAYELNLLSVVRAVRTALPLLKQRPGSSITCIVSSSVKVPIRHLALSNVFRPGIVGLAKTLSIELAPAGIRVNCVAPGRIETERVQQLDRVHAERTGRTPEEFRKSSEQSIPLGRYGHAEEFGRTVRFLVSPEASYITGQTLFVDGGLVPTLL